MFTKQAQKCVSLSEVSETQVIYKKSVALNYLHIILHKGGLFQGKLHFDINLLLFPYLYLISYTTKKKHKLE